MKIIDAHMHFSNIASFRDCALRTSMVDYSRGGYMREAADNNIAASVCMGLTEGVNCAFPDGGAQTPMLADLAEDMPPGMLVCPGINPHNIGDGLDRIDGMIGDDQKVCGIKIYAGYYHYDICDPVYAPAYDLAQRHGLPVVIHTGDTYSTRGLLTLSHPLNADRLAVMRPDMRIVLCHMGVPWVFDACEVACKNANVYIDISGMLVGDGRYVRRMTGERLLTDRYKQPLVFMDNYEKVLFGTDWPLAPMADYINFCKALIPPAEWEKVFFLNALNVFDIRRHLPGV